MREITIHVPSGRHVGQRSVFLLNCPFPPDGYHMIAAYANESVARRAIVSVQFDGCGPFEIYDARTPWPNTTVKWLGRGKPASVK